MLILRPGIETWQDQEKRPMAQSERVTTTDLPGAADGQEFKDLYSVGEIPPLGHVPAKMHAWVIRRDRHGPPEEAMTISDISTWLQHRLIGHKKWQAFQNS